MSMITFKPFSSPSSQINSLKWAGDHLVTAGIDDTVRRVEGDAYTDFAAKLQSQPRGVAHGEGVLRGHRQRRRRLQRGAGKELIQDSDSEIWLFKWS